MRRYRIDVEYGSGGFEVIDLDAEDPVDALRRLYKVLRAKEKIRGYRAVAKISCTAL